MKLTWIEDLLAIAETPSLTDAAARRNVTQPAFTRRIQAIEEHLGVNVLDRSHRPARPSNVIIGLKEQLQRLSKDLRRLSLDLTISIPDHNRQIVIACQHALSVSFAPKLIQRIQKTTQDITIKLRSGNRDECIWLFMTRQASILLAYEVDNQPLIDNLELIEKAVIWKEKIILVASPSKAALYQNSKLTDNMPIITYPESAFMGRFSSVPLAISSNTSKQFIKVTETGLTLAARELALTEIGVAWLPESLVEKDLQEGRLQIIPTKHKEEYTISLVALRFSSSDSKDEQQVWDSIISEKCTFFHCNVAS